MSDHQLQDTQPFMPPISQSSASVPSSYVNALKRRASSSFEDFEGDVGRKRFREEDGPSAATRADVATRAPSPASLANDLAQELMCGCCSELCYRPVVVAPCQHFFCGSCCMLWVRNGGTNCPACRSVSTSVTPSRPLQAIIDVLLRADPSRTRAARERLQADDIYQSGPIRVPTPRELSPEPNLNQSADFARPCPHCLQGNPYGWFCPQPIVDPAADPEHAWHLDDGTPPGHSYCGNCENLLAVQAPTTTKCDMCLVSFCGVGVQGRCVAALLHSQHPHGLSDISDLIQSTEIYDCFEGNVTEVEYMLDYISSHESTPRSIYRQIVAHALQQPAGFKPLIDSGLFLDVHGVAPSADTNPDGARQRICRICATEVFYWGIKEWWVRERSKGALPAAVTKRKDCAQGSRCTLQKDIEHTREFNHIIGPTRTDSEAAVNAQVLPLHLSHSDDLALLRDRIAMDPTPASSQDFRDAVDALI